jgi:5-methylcytosine-specific restriction endonuclease McrA
VVPRRPSRRLIGGAPVGSKRDEKRRRIYDRDGWRCVACGTSENLTLDHVVPRSRGGSDADSNLQTMCRSCNQDKADKMPEELALSV